MILTVAIAATVGYLGYLAFGASTKSVILYNLPNEDPAAVTAKIFYLLTIMGSFVIIINPIYRTVETSKWYRRCAGLDTKPDNQAPPPLARQGSKAPAMNLEEAEDDKPKDPEAKNLEDQNPS